MAPTHRTPDSKKGRDTTTVGGVDRKDPFVGLTLPNYYHPEEKFLIMDLLGESNARIFKAKNLLHDRIVSLKIAPTLQEIMSKGNMGSTEAAKQQEDVYMRFEQEARVLKRISYPPLGHMNVVKIFGAGGIEVKGNTKPVPYMEMEFIDGPSLSQFLQSLAEQGKPLLWDVAESFMFQACSAVAYVHQNKILHRDIKPSNLLIRLVKAEEGGELLGYHVTLIDFGSVLLQDARTMTMTGTAIGTPFYMSPEQLDNSHNITVRSEIYSLGCILYELLTGRVPFFAETVAALSKAISYNEVESPRRVAPDRGIPSDLCRIVLKALEKKPEDRYDNVLRFEADIESCIWDDKGPRKRLHPVLWFENHPLAWLKKHPRIFASAIGAAGLIVAGSTFDVYHHFKVRHDAAVMESQQHAASVARPPPASTTTTPLLDNLPAAPGESAHTPLASQPVPRPESTAVGSADSLKPKPDTLPQAKAPAKHSKPHNLKKFVKPPPKKQPATKEQKSSWITPAQLYRTPDTPRHKVYSRYELTSPDSSGKK